MAPASWAAAALARGRPQMQLTLLPLGRRCRARRVVLTARGATCSGNQHERRHGSSDSGRGGGSKAVAHASTRAAVAHVQRQRLCAPLS
eukprot:CAMPEP_0185170176 /NCGR_PEP_ID=MMETSP1139-20130426/18297_1 /TAXON_ID=298111 /ORGANISM="Pavlova sp., Strain CCMP459" /LENGTH=88 /DNA_ID=CAMNT_0027735725 /DNA_START=344 /DNA_END=609 /DNA_ORIENTATION=-